MADNLQADSSLPFALDDLLHQRTLESNRVEFKAGWDDHIAEAVVRTACAFANDLLNLNGGYIILGVEEQEGQPVLPPRGLGSRNLDELQKKVRAACTRIGPDYQPLIFIEHVNNQPLFILFCPGGDSRPYQAPKRKGDGRVFYVRQGPESVEAQGDTLRQLMALAAKIPFDDRRSLEAHTRDLSPTLVRRFLGEVGSKLADEEIADLALYRKLRLVAPVNAHEVPRNVGLLFFNEDPDRFFPGARIEVVRFPDDAGGDRLDEHVFRGPLPEQIRACLGYLDAMSGTLVRKRSDRPEADRTPAYPMEAVREALINAIYHRGYDGPSEPIKVYLYPDRLRISSYPGPLPGIELAHFQEGAEFPSVPARNRRIGDFLKELRLCETRGTGIPKIRRELRKIGSPPPEFRFDEGRTYFEITLPMHRQHVLAEAEVLISARRISDALGPLRRAFARQPGFVDLTRRLVWCEIKLGQIDAARAALRTFSKNMEADEEWPDLFFMVAERLIERQRGDEALATLAEMPNASMTETAQIEHASLVRDAGDLYGSYLLFEQIENLSEHAYALVKFAEAKILLAKDFTDGAREQLLWEAGEHLRDAISLIGKAEPSEPEWAARLGMQRAHVLELLDMPAREIAAAYRASIALVPEALKPKYQEPYAEWKQSRQRARLIGRRPSR
jgi:ATP-dependent DNA helicase RecG